MKHFIKDQQEASCTWSMEVDDEDDLLICINEKAAFWFKPDGRAFRSYSATDWGELGFKITDRGAIKFEDEE